MKKISNRILKNFMVALVLALICGATASASIPFLDKYSINRDDLPEAAREMLDEHFPKAKVSMVKTDKHLLKKTDYDVKLVDGTKIEFNNKGAWTSVDCGKKAVPATLLKKNMTKHVDKKHPGAKIVSVRKKVAAYEVTLSTGHLIKFTLLGTHSSTSEPE